MFAGDGQEEPEKGSQFSPQEIIGTYSSFVRHAKKNLRNVTTKAAHLKTRTPNRWNGKKMEQGH